MPLWVARRARVWKACSVPEEPVTLDELERLVLRLTGSSMEALEQQMLSRLKEQTLIGGKRVTRQALPELPKATTGGTTSSRRRSSRPSRE